MLSRSGASTGSAAEVEQRLTITLADPSPVVFHDVEDHLGWHKQADGRWYLGLHVENGRIKDTEKSAPKRDCAPSFGNSARYPPDWAAKYLAHRYRSRSTGGD